jgi:hypothetical protein
MRNGGREQRILLREIAPTVVDEIGVVKATFDAQTMSKVALLAAHAAVALPDSIAISEYLRRMQAGEGNFALPLSGSSFAKRKCGCRKVFPFETEHLAGGCKIGDVETEFHRVGRLVCFKSTHSPAH